MDNSTPTRGSDLKSGISQADLIDGALQVGHVDEEAVLLARRGSEVFATGATCTHYGGLLGAGLMVGLPGPGKPGGGAGRGVRAIPVNQPSGKRQRPRPQGSEWP